jgi:hypothetical protein
MLDSARGAGVFAAGRIWEATNRRNSLPDKELPSFGHMGRFGKRAVDNRLDASIPPHPGLLPPGEREIILRPILRNIDTLGSLAPSRLARRSLPCRQRSDALCADRQLVGLGAGNSGLGANAPVNSTCTRARTAHSNPPAPGPQSPAPSPQPPVPSPRSPAPSPSPPLTSPG